MASLTVSSDDFLKIKMKKLKDFFTGRCSLEVLRYFCDDSGMANVPHLELLGKTKFISLDEEWWQYEHLNDRITELGLVIIKAGDIRKNGLNITKTLLDAETYHLRPIENCHMINHQLNLNSERHALYAHTRFAKIKDQ